MSVLRSSFAWLSGPSLYAFIVRGVLGVGLVVAGFLQISTAPILGVALIALSLLPFGGCPMCWASGAIGAACTYEPGKDPARK